MERESVNKIVKNGNSWAVNLPRPLMHALDVEPGDFVCFQFNEQGVCMIRRWGKKTSDGERSPGMLPPSTPVVPR
jgi:antitoxin component of MazEF toxin-antitoxin module